MAGPSNQSATVTPRRGVDTPLASIRPMSVQNSRTAAVLPTSQTANVASIHGSSSNSSGSAVTALVPPQQVHSASGGMAGEVMSTTSSHTDYMPATSSAASIVVAAVSPMGKSFTQTISYRNVSFVDHCLFPISHSNIQCSIYCKSNEI